MCWVNHFSLCAPLRSCLSVLVLLTHWQQLSYHLRWVAQLCLSCLQLSTACLRELMQQKELELNGWTIIQWGMPPRQARNHWMSHAVRCYAMFCYAIQLKWKGTDGAYSPCVCYLHLVMFPAWFISTPLCSQVVPSYPSISQSFVELIAPVPNPFCCFCFLFFSALIFCSLLFFRLPFFVHISLPASPPFLYLLKLAIFVFPCSEFFLTPALHLFWVLHPPVVHIFDSLAMHLSDSALFSPLCAMVQLQLKACSRNCKSLAQTFVANQVWHSLLSPLWIVRRQ